MIFADFSEEDDERYLGHALQCEELPSDLYPEVLYGYKEHDGICRAYADGFCWHSAVRDGKPVWFPPIGNWEAGDWKSILTKNVPEGTCFTYVPVTLARMWEAALPGHIEITERRDDWDYILALQLMASVRGNRCKRLRGCINRFERMYTYSVKELDAGDLADVLEFHHRIEPSVLDGNGNYEEAVAENDSFEYTMRNWGKNPRIRGIIIRVDGVTASYCIDELLPDGRMVGVHAKSDYSYNGINPFTYREEALFGLRYGMTAENIMSDVGIESMRNSKIGFRPVAMLEKCDVRVV